MEGKGGGSAEKIRAPPPKNGIDGGKECFIKSPFWGGGGGIAPKNYTWGGHRAP